MRARKLIKNFSFGIALAVAFAACSKDNKAVSTGNIDSGSNDETTGTLICQERGGVKIAGKDVCQFTLTYNQISNFAWFGSAIPILFPNDPYSIGNAVYLGDVFDGGRVVFNGVVNRGTTYPIFQIPDSNGCNGDGSLNLDVYVTNGQHSYKLLPGVAQKIEGSGPIHFGFSGAQIDNASNKCVEVRNEGLTATLVSCQGITSNLPAECP